MFAPTTFALALAMTILSTLCWGSFANTFKLTRGFRFELYYVGYAAGIFLSALLLALTLGSHGAGEAFRANLHAGSGANLAAAALGGFIFNIANFLLLAGIEMVGLAVAFPIAIGIALVEGVALSYLIQPKGSALLLTLGVALATAAIVLAGRAYGALPAAGPKLSRKGVWVCVVSGVLMGTFAPLVTRAMTVAHALTPYTVAVLFTAGAVGSCFIFNPFLMRRPLLGTPVGWAELRATPPAYHGWAVLGGAIWGLGTVFNFVAAGLVGVAISYAIGQASPMVAALWGVFVWHEFKGAPTKARVYLSGMFGCYLLALVAIAQAYSG